MHSLYGQSAALVLIGRDTGACITGAPLCEEQMAFSYCGLGNKVRVQGSQGLATTEGRNRGSCAGTSAP